MGLSEARRGVVVLCGVTLSHSVARQVQGAWHARATQAYNYCVCAQWKFPAQSHGFCGLQIQQMLFYRK